MVGAGTARSESPAKQSDSPNSDGRKSNSSFEDYLTRAYGAIVEEAVAEPAAVEGELGTPSPSELLVPGAASNVIERNTRKRRSFKV